MDLEYGRIAVKAARAAAEAETRGEPAEVRISGPFSESCGVFVTVSEFPSGDLRGCIGYPEPIFPLEKGLVKAAVSACHDPRFPPLTLEEAKACTFEITILTPPEEIHFSDPEELVRKIVIGRDGLIMELEGRRGLFLPQVPVEWGWDVYEYLAHLSVKAGLPPFAWSRPGVRFSRFEGEIFSEVSPDGEVERK